MSEYYDPFLAGIVRIHDAQDHIIGTGFIFRLVPDLAMIATCTHVVQEALAGTLLEEGKTICLSFDVDPTHNLYKATVYKYLPVHEEDVAILKADGVLPNKIRSLPLARAALSGNRQISAFGYPVVTGFIGSWAHSEFCRVGTLQTSTSKRWLQLESRIITGGFSGAPVWDDSRCKTIGMVSKIGQPDDYGKMADLVYALPVEILQEMTPELSVILPSPFHPSEPCTEGEMESFLGDVESMDLLAKHLNHNSRFLAILGSAGCGKTSLVQVDLIPKLRNGVIGGQENWSIIKTALSAHPFRDLENAGLEGATLDLAASIHMWCQKEQSRPLILILDQFENMLLYAPKAIQTDMLTQLCQIARANIATVIIILRDDLYHLLSIYIPFLRLVEENLVNVVAPSNRESLMRMTQNRAKIYGVSFEPSFLSEITDHVLQIYAHSQAQQTSLLPTYEYVLSQLWQDKQDAASISPSATGSSLLQVDDWAERVFLVLDEQEQVIARHIFLQLVQLENRVEGIPDVRRFVVINKLCQSSLEQDLVYRFVDQGLLTIHRDSYTHEEIVSLSQSALLHKWLRLNAWLEEKSHFEQWYPTFAQNLTVPSSLSPFDVQEAELWLGRYPEGFDQGVKDSLQQNQQRFLREKELWATEQKIEQQRRIIQARQLASQVEALYNHSQGHMEEAANLALEALHLFHCQETDQCVRSCLDRIPKPLTSYRIESSLAAVELNMPNGIAAFAQADGVILLLHLSTGQWTHIDCQASITRIILSSMCSYLLVMQENGLIRIYNPFTSQEIVSLEEPPTQIMTMSPDERLFALAHKQESYSELVLYNTGTWEQFDRFSYEPMISALAFSPDGHYLAVGYSDAFVRVRDIAPFPHPLSIGIKEPLFSHEGGEAICQIEFSPGGNFLAMAGKEGYLSLWNLGTSICLFDYQPDSLLHAMVFSRNGSYFATAGEDGTVALFQLPDGQPIAHLSHEMAVQDLMFSLNEELLAAASRDGAVYIWDTITHQPTTILAQKENIQRVHFSMEEYDLFTVNQRGTITHWSTITSGYWATFPYQGSLHSLFFTKINDKNTLIAVSQEGQMSFWQDREHFSWPSKPTVSSPRHGVVLAVNPSGYCISRERNHSGSIFWNIWSKASSVSVSCESDIMAAALSPSGCYAALTERHQISIWDTHTGQCCGVVLVTTSITHLSFSKDENYVVFVENACFAYMWPWQQKHPKQRLSPERFTPINAIASNSDTYFIVTADEKGLIRMWKWDEALSPCVVKHLYDIPHTGAVSKVVFQANGQFFATAGADHTARLYEAATGEQRFVLAHNAEVSQVLFSHDARHLITASNDKTINIWDMYDGHQLARLTCLAQPQTVLLSPDNTSITTIDERGWISLWLWQTEDLEAELEKYTSQKEAADENTSHVVTLRSPDPSEKNKTKISQIDSQMRLFHS